MTREQIEKAAMGYAVENSWYPGETSYESDIIEMERSFAETFTAGAQWLADRLCHLPLDKLVQELSEYINQKEETK